MQVGVLVMFELRLILQMTFSGGIQLSTKRYVLSGDSDSCHERRKSPISIILLIVCAIETLDGVTKTV